MGVAGRDKEVVGHHHYPFQSVYAGNEVRIIYLADSISTNYYVKLLGTDTTFNYTDITMEMLNLSREVTEDIALRLPEEVERVNRIVDFDLF